MQQRPSPPQKGSLPSWCADPEGNVLSPPGEKGVPSGPPGICCQGASFLVSLREPHTSFWHHCKTADTSSTRLESRCSGTKNHERQQGTSVFPPPGFSPPSGTKISPSLAGSVAARTRVLVSLLRCLKFLRKWGGGSCFVRGRRSWLWAEQDRSCLSL